ncbi:nucleotidyltransferase domain-containing protein [Herbiconiux sp. 11R-BC]|uniref:nucleotidyltransferase domain-containing protein n=1 Tax=Herbiconiux sp. 11R-BC TaxID=3111637 RepID=UPI003C02E884
MQLQNPLAVLVPTLDALVLDTVTRANGEPLDAAALARSIGRSYTGTRETLERLVRQGIVLSQSIGRTRIYSMNTSHLLAPMIIEMVNARRLFVETLRARSSQIFTEEPAYSALFGSAARGEMREDSDIDVFLLRRRGSSDDVFEGEAQEFMREITALTGNTASALIYGEEEISAMRSQRVFTDIMRDGIAITGTVGDFRRLLREAA